MSKSYPIPNNISLCIAEKQEAQCLLKGESVPPQKSHYNHLMVFHSNENNHVKRMNPSNIANDIAISISFHSTEEKKS